jgi:hypothetical protein
MVLNFLMVKESFTNNGKKKIGPPIKLFNHPYKRLGGLFCFFK